MSTIGDMLALVDLTLMGEPADIDRIGQDLVEMAAADEPAAGRLPVPIRADRQPDAFPVESGLERNHAADLEIAAEDRA